MEGKSLSLHPEEYNIFISENGRMRNLSGEKDVKDSFFFKPIETQENKQRRRKERKKKERKKVVERKKI